ncbi:LuxR C-terminal-related transcriptional regulator [Nonomuraea sp. NPDC050663]|uniref:LuxR C-terminal-related transcriptional regulator n=1 Tax=Nonomuraea sp. NPDC050663 TaxID=3364370 RepID=UPI00379F90B7
MGTGEESAPFRVLVYSEVSVIRAGFAHILSGEPSGATVSQAATWQEVTEQAGTEPDAFLFDLRDRSASDLAPLLQDLGTGIHLNVLVVDAQADARRVREIFASGATGFIDLMAREADVRAAVAHVSSGERYIQPSVAAQIFCDPPAAGPQTRLSERESDVVRLVAQGHTQREIAEKLCISVRTVERHVLHVRCKLNVQSRAELVHYALTTNTLPSQEESR